MKRKPQRAPGPAHINHGRRIHDFTLPSNLYTDAFIFYEQARRSGLRRDIEGKFRHLRASLLASFAFFEASLNQTAFAYAAAHRGRLEAIVRDVLEEKETVVTDKGFITRRVRFYSLEQRWSFLSLFLTGREFPRNDQLWRDFGRVKRLRDRWTHPKPPFNPWALRLVDIKLSLVTLRAMLVRLAEMMESTIPLWLTPWEQTAAYFRGNTKPYEEWVDAESANPVAQERFAKSVARYNRTANRRKTRKRIE